MFQFKACQGPNFDDGALHVRTEGHDGEGFASYRTPSHADFLIAHSSVEGYFSWRNTVMGSWFIQVCWNCVALVYVSSQVLAAALTENGSTRDLETILTRVSKVVATMYESKSEHEEWNMKKQIPFVHSTLTAKVYMQPK